MICPYCNNDDQIEEMGTILIGYDVVGQDDDGNLEYGDSELYYDSFEPNDYPYYCKNCNKSFAYDFDNNNYYPEDKSEVINE